MGSNKFSQNAMDGLAQKLKSVIAQETQLPAVVYTDQTYYEQEVARIFEQKWMAVGFASEFSQPGTAHPVEVFGKPLVITCADNGAIHVFANVCRHRGHRLVSKTKERCKLLTCPYHAWSYGLDGKFVSAPYWDGTKNSVPGDDLKTSLGLIPVRFEIWYDIVVVNLSGAAESFDSSVASLTARWQAQRPAASLRRFSSASYRVNGNWKHAAENFLDNYHLPWIHSEIGSSIEAGLGLEVENLHPGDDVIGFVHPTAGKSKGKTGAALPAWPTMSETGQIQQELFFVLPNICLVMEGYYLWTMILLPSAVDKCDEKIALYVVGDNAMTDAFSQSRSELAKVIYKINDQDAEVIHQLQLGRGSEAASAGVFNDRHDQLGKWFHQAVARTMAEVVVD